MIISIVPNAGLSFEGISSSTPPSSSPSSILMIGVCMNDASSQLIRSMHENPRFLKHLIRPNQRKKSAHLLLVYVFSSYKKTLTKQLRKMCLVF